MNRLARESSPYLLLHAHNPVDWHAWGEEAFERARREDKPIFLSVGYSTCYWCHVMERECFSDEGIAAQLNQGFVSVKLDREERPDLDEIYMTATQLLTRSGGWPNSLFLTHDLKPFFAGTYFPPQDRFGRPGFPRVLRGLHEAWSERRADVLEQAEAIAGAIREQMAGAPPHPPGPDAPAILAASLSRRFDPEWGGFGGAPKFPSPSNLELLLDLAGQGDEAARTMLVVTLDRMARGGIQDQVAGGFHRYSTDAEWLVPHFEKMLYDNAALAALYAEADPLAPAEGFARVARRTLDFVLAEMTAPAGAFLSAIDAETDGHEGAYYTWSREELKLVLSGEELTLASLVHGLEGRPTFEEDRYVPYLPAPLRERAAALGLGEAELLARLEPVHAALLEARGRRKHPLVDDKVLTDWNGLMVGAMARCGRLLDEDRYVQAASRAAGFVLERLQDPASGLLHVYRNGAARIPAFLDDYAFLVHGLLELHDASAEPRWLREAVRLQAEQDRRLWDPAAGGYFNAGHDPQLMVQAKSAHDGAMASGNGVAALNLLRLASSTGNAAFEERARTVVEAFGRGIDEYPLAHVTLVRAQRLLDREEAGAGIARREAARPLTAAAEAAVRVAGRLRGKGTWRAFEVDLEVGEGWHLNANPASLTFLVPTAVGPGSGAVRGVRYPEGEVLQAASSTGPLRIYRGRIRIEGELEVREGVAPALRLTYQACDDLRCLPPVTREVPLAAEG